MPKRILQGTVVSDKGDKTVVVSVERRFTDPVMKKTVRKSKRYHAHDETNEVNNIWSGTIVVNPVQSELGDSSNSDGALSAYSSYLWIAVVLLGLLGILVFMYGPNQIQKIE